MVPCNRGLKPSWGLNSKLLTMGIIRAQGTGLVILYLTSCEIAAQRGWGLGLGHSPGEVPGSP